MISLLLLQCILEILMLEIQSGGMVIPVICRVPSLHNQRHNIVWTRTLMGLLTFFLTLRLYEMSSAINFCKSEFHYFFPPTYGRRIWDFSMANVSAIRHTVNCVDLERAFNALSINERVKFLTECVLNVFNNIVQNKVITIRSKDTFWMTPEI